MFFSMLQYELWRHIPMRAWFIGIEAAGTDCVKAGELRENVRRGLEGSYGRRYLALIKCFSTVIVLISRQGARPF
jgi:hypothetical protein